MGRSPCCSKEGLNRGAWTAMEDKILTEYIKVHGEGKWRNLPKRAGLKRCGKSCRLRWLNYLRPDIKRGNITHDEEELIIRLHNLLGNRWSLIAGRLPGRTDNEIKNYWNTNIGKKIQSSHDHAATSNMTSCLPKAKPSLLKQLPPPSPNRTTHYSSTAQQLHSKSSATTATTSSPKSSVVWTKATKCTKVLLQLPQDIPKKKIPILDNHDHHHNSSKPAVDYTVVPRVTSDVDKVNDIFYEMVPGLELHDDHEPLEVPFNVPADNHESNSSQFMALHDDHHLDFDHEKFLADFLNIESLDLDLSDCFGINIGENDHDHDRDKNMIMSSSSPSSNSANNKGFDKTSLLFSQDMALFGVELQSGTANNNSDLTHPRDEMYWLQD